MDVSTVVLLLVALCCPVCMWLMMRGMKGHRKSDDGDHRGGSAPR